MNHNKIVREKIKRLATKFALKEVGRLTNPDIVYKNSQFWEFEKG